MKCPKCGVHIKSANNFHRHVKRCGTSEHRAQCPFCPKSFSRNDDLKTHLKKKHPQTAVTSGFTCDKCQKTFTYEMTLNVHQNSCGVEKAKPFKCTFPECGKSFTRKFTLEQHHREHLSQQKGGGIKRKADNEEDEPPSSEGRWYDCLRIKRVCCIW